MPRGVHPNSLANLKKGKATQFGANGDLTAKEARKKGIEAQAERKTIREGLLMLLNEHVKGKDGETSGETYQDAIIVGLVKRSATGDPRAVELLLKIIGEAPKGNNAQDQAMQKARELLGGVPDALDG